jgi:hypothetical protein
LPRVGVYDRFAVDWGYRQFPEGADEQAELEKIVGRQIDDPLLRFGNPEPREDPTRQTEDLGADAVEATRLGLRNLERVAGYLVEATSKPGEDYELLENMHEALLGQWRREMVHVANVVGGVERVNLYYGDADRRFFPVAAGRQREAVRFLNEHAFRTPRMFLDPDVTGRLEAAGVSERIVDAQRAVLASLLDEERAQRMSELAESASGEVYQPVELMQDVTDGIWSELSAAEPRVNLYRRNLQRTHVGLLTEGLASDELDSDLAAVARAQLETIRQRAREALGHEPDPATAAHLQDIDARITLAIDHVFLEREWDDDDSIGTRGMQEPF